MTILLLRGGRAAAVLLLIVGITHAQDTERAAAPLLAPDGMVLIPAGPFLMGNNNEYFDNDNDEKPRHAVNLHPFFIDIYPVTNDDYKIFVEATGHRYPQYWSDAGEIPPGQQKHPVTGVNYMDATAFAAWKGRRLPTEQEWEKASRGAGGLRWPWGNVFDKAKANVGQRTTTPVGSYPEGCNAYGVCDMAGNVFEWTSTRYAPYPDAPPNRAILRFLNDRYLSVRGGSYGSDIGSARGADRGVQEPDEPSPALGFRTVMDIPGYAGYRAAWQTMELARETSRTAASDISEYEEHTDARALLAEAAEELSRAEDAFIEEQFVESGLLAQASISKASKAQQLALDYKRDYLAKQQAGTAEVLGRLEARLAKLPPPADRGQQALVREAEDHLQQGRQFEAEGGWGYAQMHGYIGLAKLQRISR
ncbi:MAG: formylglycine-generating enzyme family protein [Gammaproteobacteria bacterium]|nr:formylglycine-generating enzyme family protein [Gammaproteobacteria bacterium]